ncbi:MAG: S8 family serine peptidase, partial [Kibdelosporangium sp.]
MTLLTGDQVFLRADGSLSYLQPGPGRERQTFTTYQTRGHQYVVPSDAAALLARGVLDQRLFDVTELRTEGYGGSAPLPLIVKYAAGERRTTVAVTQDLPSINGAAVSAERPGFWNSLTAARSSTGIAKIWLDGKRTATLDHSVPQIGAPAAWQAGFTGTGVTVAVLDTGVDETHPDLADREVGGQNFSGSPDAGDHYGHGTHVASIIAGTGAKSGGKYRGVAPGARILDVKVLKDNGSGADSGIIAGMQWAAEQGADVINMSLGGFDSPEVDPLEEAVNTLSAQYGTLFVIAGGNSGPGAGTIGSPGSADAALTVGAVDRDNKIADFSSVGPREGGGTIKPDITAPGVEIVAARHADGRIGQPVGDGYTALSGTSMATPHVAGAAALLAQQRPELDGEQLKARLIGGSTPTPGLTPYQQGAGRVDSAKVLTQTVTSQPSSLSFGSHQWPHTSDPAVTQEVTYANDGTTPVTLDLRVEATGPAGLYSVSPARLVVPAGGKASATVKAEIRNAPAGGQFGGALVAASGGQSVRTAVAVDLEPESYDLVINGIGRSGGPADYVSAFLINVETGDPVYTNVVDGKAIQRVPAGRYLLSGSILGSEPYTHDVLTYPNLTVSGPTTVDLDARLAKPVSVRLPEPTARLSLLQVAFQRVAGPNTYTISNLSFGGSVEHIGLAHLGPDLPAKELTGQLATSWTARDGAEFYGLAWYLKGRTHSGLSKDIRRGDLATVNVDIGPLPPGQTANLGLTSSPRGQGAWGSGSLDNFTPGARTEYYGGENADWARRMTIFGENGYAGGIEGPPKTYLPGRSYQEPFYRGVFGPVLPDNRDDPWVQQRGDLMVVTLPLFGDGVGNAGFSAVDSASTKLYRDGQLFGETPEPGFARFVIPAGKAKYRLTAEASRSGYPKASKVSGAWTFEGDRSGAVAAWPL